MPNILQLFHIARSWRVDIADEIDNKSNPPTTPVITLTATINQPEKSLKMKSSKSSATTPLEQNTGWFCLILQRVWRLKSGNGSSEEASELQNILPSVIVQKDNQNPQEKEHTVCLMTESPFRILRAAESGNLETFQRLYFADPSRLIIRDTRGRTAAHQAAFKNRINILQFISAHGGDLNIQDNVGNTPLHVAVESDALDAVDYLLQIGVNTAILNEKKQAPIHLVSELNKVSVLEVMMDRHKSKIDIQQGGEHGRTALHLAAIYDHEECARILITQFGACPRQPCNNGYYPIHEAAKNASSKTLEVFLQWGEKNGCSREEMISFYDAEGNVPLHSAVHGGDMKAVELCIKSGAKISTQQHDLSTPVHLACAQGATEIVKIMFQMQPEEKFQCLQSCDIQKMTPLHCAAMFDHPDIVEYLVLEGADINLVDKEKRSPLLLAASRAGWKTVHTLIRLGADINIKDSNRRNVLHLVVMNGGRLEQFATEVNKSKYQNSLLHLLNEKDNTGCSPLHYASREGHIRSLENLIRLGAVINLKNNNNQSPLHFAARYGRYNTVKQLLDSEKGTFIINESDGEGMTPLHISSQQGHTRVVQLLLNRGALLHRDHNGRTPLHLAAMNGYTLTIELLLCVHSHLLDQTDKDGNSALHLATMESKPSVIALLLSKQCKLLYNKHQMSAVDYAIHYKYPEAALAMVTHEKRAEEVLLLKSDKHPCVTLALIASMPRVFEAVQDQAITKANCKKDSKSFYIKYNFTCLECPQFYANMDGKTGEALSISKPIPLPALNAMVSHGRVELLAHPLSQKYLQMKWNSYGKYFHIANLLFYSIFLSFVTCFSSQLMAHEHLPADFYRQFYRSGNGHFSQSMWRERMNKTYEEFLADAKADILKVTISPIMYISAMGIVVYIGVNSVRELIQLYQQKFLYCMDPTNLVSWMLYTSAVIMVFPVFGGTITELQFSFASITVFLSWLNLLLLLQRFDQVGIYVVMFLEILQTLIKVLMVFSILIIAFGLAFYILLSRGEHLSFRTIPMSLVRTFSMMLGEIDFLGTYVEPFYLRKDDGRTLPFPIPAFLILAVFMVLMPILLMNLLIGLAVGDIESVRRNAQLKRLAMQVVLHTELERKLPKIVLDRIDKSEIIEFPNDNKCKLGFIDSIIRRWFGNPFSDDGNKETYVSSGNKKTGRHGVDMIMESNEDYLANEIEKTKRRLRDISKSMDTQQQLLRLIVQKMEIKTEADDVDEGVSSNDIQQTVGSGKWTPNIKKKLRSALSFTKST